jgi:hypothetical protein
MEQYFSSFPMMNSAAERSYEVWGREVLRTRSSWLALWANRDYAVCAAYPAALVCPIYDDADVADVLPSVAAEFEGRAVPTWVWQDVRWWRANMRAMILTRVLRSQ